MQWKKLVAAVGAFVIVVSFQNCSAPNSAPNLSTSMGTLTMQVDQGTLLWGIDTSEEGLALSSPRTYTLVTPVTDYSYLAEYSSINLSYSIDANSTFICTLDGAPLAPCGSDVAVPTPTDYEIHELTVVATNPSGDRFQAKTLLARIPLLNSMPSHVTGDPLFIYTGSIVEGLASINYLQQGATLFSDAAIYGSHASYLEVGAKLIVNAAIGSAGSHVPEFFLSERAKMYVYGGFAASLHVEPGAIVVTDGTTSLNVNLDRLSSAVSVLTCPIPSGGSGCPGTTAYY